MFRSRPVWNVAEMKHLTYFRVCFDTPAAWTNGIRRLCTHDMASLPKHETEKHSCCCFWSGRPATLLFKWMTSIHNTGFQTDCVPPL